MRKSTVQQGEMENRAKFFSPVCSLGIFSYQMLMGHGTANRSVGFGRKKFMPERAAGTTITDWRDVLF